MARDLGIARQEVHKSARGVLRFWLEEVPPEKRFARDAAVDEACRTRFGALREAAIATHGAGWRGEPATLLAAIILIDQFSRNIFRGDARAFAADPLARALAREALARGWDRGLSPVERQFLYMPFMHSEDMDDQVRSLALYGAPDMAFAAAFARDHAAEVAQHGRFTARDAALGRVSAQ